MRPVLWLFPLTLVVTACGSLAGCDTIGKVLGPAPVVSSTVIIDDQALGLAYGAGILANKTATVLATHGIITRGSPLAVTLNTRLDQYDLLVKTAEAAKAAGDASGYTAKLTAAKVLLAQINTDLEAVR